MIVAQKSDQTLRAVVFGTLAAFILLAPAMQQVLKIYNPIFRPWVMYSGVGLGLLRGEFDVVRAEKTLRITAESFLGVRFYPSTMSLKDSHVVLGKAALVARIAAYCDANPDVMSVAFDGLISTTDGWRPISVAETCKR